MNEARRIAWTGKTAVEIIDAIPVVGPETFPCAGRCGARNEEKGTLCESCRGNAEPWVYERWLMFACAVLLSAMASGLVAKTFSWTWSTATMGDATWIIGGAW